MNQDTELELWKEWKRNPTPANEQKLLASFAPLIEREVQRWRGVLADELLRIKAQQLVLQALKEFSPYRNVKLSTFIVNNLQQLSRLTYTHQNVARIPEHRVLKISAYKAAKSKLEAKFGREPTVQELAEELAWPVSHVERMQRELHQEFVESGVPLAIFDRRNTDANTVAFIYNDLSPLHKKIFEHTTGWGGSKILKMQDLAKKLGMTVSQLSYQKTLMTKEIEKRL